MNTSRSEKCGRLITAALDHAPEDREAFLRLACGADEGLFAEVKSLLAAHEAASENFLKGSAMAKLQRRQGAEETVKLQDASQDESSIFPPGEKPGERICNYKLLQPIGEGGFGTVWMAEQEQPVRRRVALKIIKLGMDTKEVVARFDQERQALALMDHPNIAKVFDAGATELGRPFFVMELVRGERITDYCDKQELSITDRIGLFIQVCHAVQHAHQKGIIHRDLKPSNILVTVNDGVAVPKIIDFGVAKATQGTLTERTLFTRFDQMIGTPVYMSPEQAEMTSLDVDSRSDIYSLGVLLYELLTGHTPVDYATMARAGVDEIRRLICEVDPPRPSAKLRTLSEKDLTTTAKRRHAEPVKLPGVVRGDLDWIVMKCLEKDRKRRYETANGLALELQRHLNNEVIIARPPTTRYLLGKLIKRNKLAFAAGTGIALSLVVGIVASVWQAVRATRAEKAAHAEAQRATAAEKLAATRLKAMTIERDEKETARREAEAVSNFMNEIFQRKGSPREGRTVTVAELLDQAVKKVDTDLSKHPELQAKLRHNLADNFYSLGLYHESIPLYEKAREYCLATLGAEDLRTLEVLMDLGRAYIDVGRKNEALKIREETLAAWRKREGEHHSRTLLATRDLAESYYACGRRDEALKILEDVTPKIREALGSDHSYTLSSLGVLAMVLQTANRLDEAVKLREEIYQSRLRVGGAEHADTLWAMNMLAGVYMLTHREHEALGLYEKCVTSFRKSYTPQHPWTLNAITALAKCYGSLGRHEEAAKQLEASVPDSRKVLGNRHLDTSRAISALAESFIKTGRYGDAFDLLNELEFEGSGFTFYAMKLRAMIAWSASGSDRAKFHQRLLQWVADTKSGYNAERAARLICLYPIDDLSMREEILAQARNAVNPRENNKGHWPRYQMTLGMAEYRSGNYPAAEAALTAAVETASDVLNGQGSSVAMGASYYRVMCLFQQDRQPEAHELFTTTEAKMKPLPPEGKISLLDVDIHYDDIVLWLAYKEARAMLQTTATPTKAP
ncbi:non-specific serine/threonine protein kinase/serine/threonine-protein kinase [Roseimicrobium gellanilyticum]|uniref:Non-specific serine/threonine protein kinase/serine/threonine-protein kinase n=1 Tax=Roseimicrobium gellanilyticum TaxID=748857 RepID=A0A366H3E2_9BACT|nr:serine/threonine-protein kinase [Roseimicrobium gellanilyticum]RBP36069.1 non-specific serine/threonine protein kinase/serine/threonine-protein kinase [Roseimicrobium gellanilyticum]